MLTWCAAVNAEELETATRQKKQRIEAQMAMRGSHGTAPLVGSAGSAAPSIPADAEASAGAAATGAQAAGRAMTEDEEMAAAIAASLEGSSGTEESSDRPARVDSPAIAAVELQPEPAEGSANVSAMAFRLPTGERVQRKFAGERSLQDAFDYLQIEHGLEPGSYSMVRPTATLSCLQHCAAFACATPLAHVAGIVTNRFKNPRVTLCGRPKDFLQKNTNKTVRPHSLKLV
eukprot:COSAG02_NODE_1869_length_10591_cov_184.261056_3_plen_231_part_00